MENADIVSKEVKPTTENNEVIESQEVSLEENSQIDEAVENNSNSDERLSSSKVMQTKSSNFVNPSVDEKATEATEDIGDDYGCEHYKRKSKFVVRSTKFCFSYIYFIKCAFGFQKLY